MKERKKDGKLFNYVKKKEYKSQKKEERNKK